MKLTVKLKYRFTNYDDVHEIYLRFEQLFSFVIIIPFDYNTNESTKYESYMNSY